MTAYPSASDYNEAVQDPQQAFRRPELRRAEFALDPRWGIPLLATGSNAVVFRAAVNGRDQALRFFTREDVSEKRRYTALSSYFTTHGLHDCASTAWWDNAVHVNGQWWPMIQMEWVEGRTLDSYVGYLVDRGDVGALHVLAGSWRDQVKRLQTAEFAHGDLQHGNVLVDTTSALRLVDFDGSWIADFDGWTPPRETGNENYQRPGRVWGRWMDTFPALVIYTALLAVARRPDAWHRHYDENNLLFSRDDFTRPDRTPTWQLLAEITDPQVEHAVGRLRVSCASGWRGEETLEQLLSPRSWAPPVTTTEPSTTPPVFVLSDAPRRDWYRDAGMPAPPPVPTSHAADEKPTFGGVRGSAADGAPGAPPHRPPPPPPYRPPTPVSPSPRSAGGAVAAAVGIAVVLAVLVGVGVAESGGDAGLAALITALVAFVVALPILRHRQ